MTSPAPLGWMDESLAAIKRGDLFRARNIARPLPGGQTQFADVIRADFTSNDYLGLSRDPRILAAAWQALEEFANLGSGASALVSGRSPASARLEAALAQFEGTQDALLFPTGYAANLGVITSLIDDRDIIFCDKLNHACLIDGCRLSRAAFRVYRSDRLELLEDRLARAADYPRRWIITEGVFGMDGLIAPLAELHAIASRHDACLIVDEAHATGVIGPTGRGSCELAGLDHTRVIRTGTLSKAVGALGGFVPGSTNLIEYLWNNARTQMFSTALPPVVCAAATAAVRRIATDSRSRDHLGELIQHLRNRLESELPPSGPKLLGDHRVPIVPLLIGDSVRAMEIAGQLAQRGFAVAAIRPPTVPRGTARLRISLSASHDLATVDALASALIELSRP